MSYNDSEFRSCSLHWVVTQADPEFFSSASVVLSGSPGEPNLDALAQLARLVLRYFDQAIGRRLSREYIPGIQSLVEEPYEDLWRLVGISVAVSLLSDCNGSKQLFGEIEGDMQVGLRHGIEQMWDFASDYAGDAGRSLLIRSASTVNESSSIRDSRQYGPDSYFLDNSQNIANNEYSAVGHSSGSGSSRGRIRALVNRNSNDSFSSMQTSATRPFMSAHSSFPDQQSSFDQLKGGGDPSGSKSRASVALIQLSEDIDEDDTEHGFEYNWNKGIGEQRASSELEEIPSSDSGKVEEGLSSEDEQAYDDDESDTESYVTEFSQDLEAYGEGFESDSEPHQMVKYVFVANVMVYFLVGAVLLLITNSSPNRSPYFESVKEMVGALLVILAVSCFSVSLGFIWVLLLRHQTRKIIWLTTLGVPLVSSGIAVWASVQIFRIPVVEGIVGYRIRTALVLFISIVLSIRFTMFVMQRRQDIERSVDVVRASCDVLFENKGVYGFSVLLLAMYVLFTISSCIFASRIAFIPLVYGGESTSGIGGFGIGLAMYFGAMYLWISAVFVQTLRVVVSSVVSQWYFHRHDPGEPSSIHTLQAAFISSLSSQLGIVAVSGVVLLAVKSLRLVEFVIRWTVSLLRFVPVSIASMLVGRPLRIVERWNSYSVVYAAFTGKGFFESSGAATKLLHAHHLLHSSVVSLIKASLSGYVVLVSLLLGYAVGVNAVDMLSPHSAAIAIIGSIVPYAFLQLVTHVLLCTVEALVLCYAIDLQVDSCHSIKVSEALALM